MNKSKSRGQPANKWVHLRQVGATKAFQRALFLIMLGFGAQMEKAVELGMSTLRTIEADLFPALHAESSD